MEETRYAIDIAPLLLELLSALAAVLLAAGTWAIKRLATKFGLENDAKIRSYLEDALVSGIEFGKKKVEKAIEGMDDVQIKDKVVAEAASYVVKGVPDALRHFGVTEERLKEMLLARLT